MAVQQVRRELSLYEVGDAPYCARPAKAFRGRALCEHGNRSNPPRQLFSILLDPWIHPFWTVLRQLVVIAPHVGMVVVELRQEVMQLCGIL
jgi:hypothetical protein